MKTFIYLCLMLGSIQAYASHLLGGYIQAKPVANGSLQYEITVTLYYDEVSGRAAAANARSVTVCFGDGTTGETSTNNQRSLFNNTASLNTFKLRHTFAGQGTYIVSVNLANRTSVVNIDQAMNLPLTLTTNIVINSQFSNQTPNLSIPETGFRFAVNRRTSISLLATDADGDSLTYSLARPLTSSTLSQCDRLPVQSFQFPNDVTQQGTFKLDSRTGTIAWDVPTKLGQYTVAVLVEERRSGVVLSQTLHEIPIFVEDRPGTPDPLPPYEPAIEGVGGSVVAESPTDADVQITTYPNPTDDRLQIVIRSNKLTTANLQLWDVSGRLLHESSFDLLARQHEQRIDLGNLAGGVYLVRTNVGGRSVTQKIVKK